MPSQFSYMMFFYYRCLSNALMAKMNVRGNKGKIAFGKTILYTLIKGRYTILRNIITNVIFEKYSYNMNVAHLFLKEHLWIAWFIHDNHFWLISECVLASSPRATESSIDLVIGKYLKYAPERAGGGGRKEKNNI